MVLVFPILKSLKNINIIEESGLLGCYAMVTGKQLPSKDCSAFEKSLTVTT